MKAFTLNASELAMVEHFVADHRSAESARPAWARLLCRQFCARVGDAAAWQELSVEEKLALPRSQRRVASWLLASGRAHAPAGYLVGAGAFLGDAFARSHRAFFEEFTAAATAIGFAGDRPQRQWSSLAQAAALHGVGPAALTAPQILTARNQLREALLGVDRAGQAERISAALFQAQVTLFHLGVLHEPPRKTRSTAGLLQRAEWDTVASGVAETMQAYLTQLTLTRRPGTVRQVEGTLREFARFLSREAADVSRVSDIRRRHVEAYRLWLAKRPAQGHSRPVARKTQAKRLAILRHFFERLVEWESDDAPTGRLVTDADTPILDRPLPRFIDDSAAARLLVAARAVEDPFDRLAVEFIARTGLRVGEFLDLTIDAVVQIGSSFWLRVPLGKLHNDRYIPLHPQLKVMLDTWLAARPTELRSPFLWISRGRRIGRARVGAALNRAAASAGIAHVAPHQLRHTLATQAKPRHEPGGARRPPRAQVAVDDPRLCPHRRPDRESAWDPRRLHTLEVRMEHDIEAPCSEEVPARAPGASNSHGP
ncbi:MAG: tyrosine-type recombinase/integrase [Acidimicrobiales bacterium]